MCGRCLLGLGGSLLLLELGQLGILLGLAIRLILPALARLLGRVTDASEHGRTGDRPSSHEHG